jgi:PAS domain S-box-containing protein
MNNSPLSVQKQPIGAGGSTALALCDAQGRIVQATAAFARHLGISAEACVGMDIRKLLPAGMQELPGTPGAGSWEHNGTRWSLTPDQDEAGRVVGYLLLATVATGNGSQGATLHHAVDALQVEGGVLRTMMDNADAAMFMMDHRQRCIYMNPAAERLTGFTLAEVQGDALHNFIHHLRPDGSHYPLEECPIDRALPERARMKGEDVFVRKDGSFYPVAFVASPIVEEGVSVGTVIEVRDITGRKQNEAKILEANQRYDLVVKATSDAIWDWDLRTERLWWSEGFTTLFGHPRTGWQVGLEEWFTYIHPADQARVKDGFDAVLKGGGAYWVDEYRFRCADGEYRHVYDRGHVLRDGTGVPVRMVGAMQDITARKEAERRLKRSEAELLELANSITQLAWMARPDGHVFWYNERWYEYTGTTAETMEGWGWQAVHHPDLLPQVVERWQQAIRTGERIEIEFPLRAADGSYRWFLTVAEPLKDEQGRLVRWFGTNTDIHERRTTRVNALFLADLGERLAPLTDGQAILHTALEGLRTHLKLPAVFCCTDEENPAEWSVVGAGGEAWRRPEDPSILHLDMRKPTTVADVAADGSALAQWARAQDPGVAALLAARQPGRHHTVTTFLAWRGTAGAWTTEELDLVQEVLQRVWVGLERTRAEIALKRSEEKYRGLFNSIDEGFCVIEVLYDEQGRPNDWCFVEMNPMFMQHTGFGDAIGKRMTEMVPDIEQHWMDRYAQVDRSGEPLRLLDHSPALGRWFDLFAFPIGDREDHRIAVLFRDVSEEKRTEEQLRRTHALWETLFGSLHTCIYVKDAEGRMVDVNEATRAVLGKRSDGSTGNLPDSVQEAAAIAANDRKVLESGSTLTFEEIMTMDGEPHTFFSTKTALRDSDGRVTGLVGISIDITERKRYEDMLLDMDLRKDQFLATLAHELRNPLAPLRNGLQILEFSANEPELLDTTRQMMDRQLTHLVRLVDDLMDMSRINRGRIELRSDLLDLCELMRDCVEGVRSEAEAKGHSLHLVLPPLPVRVNGDSTRLAQAVDNVLNNAIRYTPKTGRIDVAVQAAEDVVRVVVRDTGIGMVPEQIPRAFDVFTQLDHGEGRGAGGGLGIGLALVRQLIEMHGGSVTAFSAGPGMGSTFTLRLPFAQEEGPAVQAPTAAPVATMDRKRRVLVVDDIRDVADSMAQLLRKLGHEVQVCYDGEEAIAAAQEQRPEVIFMDLGMPRVNGYSACRIIRGHPWGHDIRIVAISGWGQEQDKARTTNAGFDAHLVKPVSVSDIKEVLG